MPHSAPHTPALHSPRPRRAFLAAGAAAGAALLAALTRPFWPWRRPTQPPPPTPRRKLPLWSLELPWRGAIVAGVAPDRECLYLAAVRDHPLRPSGALCCVDPASRRILWTYDDNGAMLQTISTPCVAGGRVYVGEGMHGDFLCKLHAVESATGRKAWQATACGHIEAQPCVAGGLVFFAAGDDGLHAVDARTGALRWHFAPDRHIDTRPEVVAEHGRTLLFGGGGLSQRFRSHEVFCLEARTGRPVWRVEVDLPVWGSPVADAGEVFVGLGNGRLTQSIDPPAEPAGALLCLESATGAVRWRVPAEDGVLVRPAVDGGRAYFVSRDGLVRAVERSSGRVAWQVDLGAPLVAAPTLCAGLLYVAASEGPLACLEAQTGRLRWTFDVKGHTRAEPRLFSAPAVVRQGAGRVVYLGTELRNGATSAAVLYALADEEGP